MLIWQYIFTNWELDYQFVMIEREAHKKVHSLLGLFKAIAITGPRQSGKTTLSKQCAPDKPYVSLENPVERNFAIEDPVGFLKRFPDGAILDEVQRAPEILSFLQEILDNTETKGMFILTGSNNFLLLDSISQSLAGRVAYLELLPFSHEEIKNQYVNQLDDVILKGGYPLIHTEEMPVSDWFSAYVRTYVERDVRQVKNIGNLLVFDKFLYLCANRTGQLLNYSNLSIELGVDHKTVQSWIGILQASYIIFLLPPYYNNYNKRILKSPKLYFCDTGLACYLLNIRDKESLTNHPFRGSLFENYVVLELLKQRYNDGARSNLFFWRDNSGHEIDILIDQANQVIPVEVKSGATIQKDYFKNLSFFKKIAETNESFVVYGGDESQKRILGQVLAWDDLSSLRE